MKNYTTASFKKAFPHGSRVKCTIESTEINDAKISYNSNGRAFICQNEKSGSDADDKLGYVCSWVVFNSKGLLLDDQISAISRIKKETAEDLVVGDILIDENDGERIVFGTYGRVIALSYVNEQESYGIGSERTIAEVNEKLEDDWSIKQDLPAEAQEMTVEEISKELGREVKIVKGK